MSPITTHILDTSRGRPAEGVLIHLEFLVDDAPSLLMGQGHTNADGRLPDLLPTGHVLAEGPYRLTFFTGEYFARLQQASFYPQVEVLFLVTDGLQHHHVPLLLNPFGYSTYRGS